MHRSSIMAKVTQFHIGSPFLFRAVILTVTSDWLASEWFPSLFYQMKRIPQKLQRSWFFFDAGKHRSDLQEQTWRGRWQHCMLSGRLFWTQALLGPPRLTVEAAARRRPRLGVVASFPILPHELPPSLPLNSMEPVTLSQSNCYVLDNSQVHQRYTYVPGIIS